MNLRKKMKISRLVQIRHRKSRGKEDEYHSRGICLDEDGIDEVCPVTESGTSRTITRNTCSGIYTQLDGVGNTRRHISRHQVAPKDGNAEPDLRGKSHYNGNV